ncbi:hypothetical protein HH310_10355 [Actinoplanes sp. TBRC 11911]|uniref:hypothetical protein n=1 Tax=Actinoplanes sp. TBRC 11911 TaxID=2729386 RepID=UPI00145E6BDE|nr:hypothetical protein [Actinoplanes sp. TBRC 11911]NMO51592.1 hypothetical protein [Actinoplanes sp. TBRC 11911]
MTVIATLRVERPGATGIDRARAYEIIVDGEPKGVVRSGHELSLALQPGRHVVRARLDWTGSAEVPVHLGPGATVRLVVRSRGVRHVIGKRYLSLTPIDD